MGGAGKPSGKEKADSLFAGKISWLMESDEHLYPGYYPPQLISVQTACDTCLGGTLCTLSTAFWLWEMK